MILYFDEGTGVMICRVQNEWIQSPMMDLACGRKCVNLSCGFRETVSDIPAGPAGRAQTVRGAGEVVAWQRGAWSAHTRCASQGLGPAPGGIHATFWLTAVRHSQRVRLHDPFDWPFRRVPRTKRTQRNLQANRISHRWGSDAESSV